MQGKIFVISGLSGSGKTTAISNVLQMATDYNLQASTSYTTRRPRDGEVDGKDYFFVDEEAFLKLKNEGFFLETVTFNKNFYGTPADLTSQLEKHNILVVCDINGLLKIKKMIPEAITIFLIPSSISDLEYRMQARGDSELDIQKRVKINELDLRTALQNNSFISYKVTADDKKQTAEAIFKIIQKHL